MEQSLPEKLTGTHPVQKALHFVEPKGSLPHSRAPATCALLRVLTIILTVFLN